jgi:hypothetical protein
MRWYLLMFGNRGCWINAETGEVHWFLAGIHTCSA